MKHRVRREHTPRVHDGIGQVPPSRYKILALQSGSKHGMHANGSKAHAESRTQVLLAAAVLQRRAVADMAERVCSTVAARVTASGAASWQTW
jgi:hypothetical protein